MKKILLVLTLLLCGCIHSYDTAPRMKDYSQVPLLELPVSRINVISEVGQMERLPHVENQMPLTPEKALKGWAIRLRPNYQKKHKAEFVIEKAEMIREDAPEKNIFTYDNYKYTLSYQVTIRILDENATVIKTMTVTGYTSHRLPQRASVIQRDNMFAQMLREMEDQLDDQVPQEIKQKLLDP
ncbi:MAG: hypothetical protein J6P93_05310 [Alphaproteobacteria bacterium]|nr:hypothetical protein [Alphaproteobacteria bacterium]